MNNRRFIRDKQEPVKRLVTLSVIATIVFFLLFVRLWYLQVLKGEELRQQSESNRLRFLPIASSRGKILDRNGSVIVNNAPSFVVTVIPQDVQDKDALIGRLTSILQIDRDELLDKWERGRRKRARYFPIILSTDITRDQVERLEENRLFLPGVNIEVMPLRQYPDGSLAAHLLGSIGEISEQELEDPLFATYNPGDFVGKGGVERGLERDLHGTDGGRQIEVDAMGRALRTVRESQPVMGSSVMLTIDQDLQQEGEKALAGQAGAAVVMDVTTGEVLSFVSSPTFDPTLFAGRMPPQVWRSYLMDKRHPLENKALKGQYPPGSTFKIVTALAALSEGVIDEGTTFECTGSYKKGERSFRCWNRQGHGRISLRRALKESCDVYFYRVGEQLGVDRIALYARKFGLGEPTGILGLDNEKGGLIPTSQWKEKRFGTKWYPGETLPVAIGQGYVLLTPLQLASMTATVANGGTLLRPHVVKRVLDQDGHTVRDFPPEVVSRLDIPPRDFQLVTEGLSAVVNEAGGTGGRARLSGIRVAGKTGTAQVIKQATAGGYLPYEYRDHALFVAFAPVGKPEVAVAVVVEHGGHGGDAAASVAGRILAHYFKGRAVQAAPVKKVAPVATAPVETGAPEPGPVSTPAGD
ncbi:MAG TPA: penicillin-binding protein 2 [Geobacterales bacterium]|nr:penicillin-binding protein 2 [Geobacterales bacterium]